jgi:response regulator NasT
MRARETTKAAMTRKGRILVVDDDRLVLATVTHGLAEAGYEVIDADNGSDAILLADEYRPALALLDIRMEGLSGFDVAAYLRDVCRIPFMFLSAFSDAETAARVKELGAVAYLIKPLDVAQIVPLVDSVFERLQAAPATLPAAPGSAVAAGVPAAAATEAATVVATEADRGVVLVATGILMHRYSLARTAAAARLQRLAAEQGLTDAEQAERLVQAVEELSR